jgi:hypothetical protein
MKTAMIRLLVAAVLFGGAVIFWSEAALARRVADAHVRLATLHYDEEDGIGEASTALNRLAVPIVSLDDDIRRHRAQVTYWRTRADTAAQGAQPAPAAPLPGVRGGNRAEGGEPTDPDLMFVATNTAFRAATRQTADRAAAVERLDTVIQAYAEVLRSDPGNADAAYNYEYAVRFRDSIARARPGARGRRPADEPGASVDLPAGPTIHGRPGGPPPDLPGDQFRTIAPMPYEEREESDPGRGPAPRRRG